jgi:hypothetical protein
MKALRCWIAKRARAAARRPSLDHALWSDQAWRYALYRFRFLAIRAPLQTALFSLEIYLFSLVYALEFLWPMLVYRSASALLVGLWWAGLETLRDQVRQAARRGQWNRVRQVIDGWLAISLLFGAAVVTATMGWIRWGPSIGSAFTVFDAYGLACALRLVLDVIATTYQSGIYALRRIRRPLWSLLIGDLLEFTGFILLWEPLGPWGFALTIAVVGAVRSLISIRFTRHAYVASRIPASNGRRILRPFYRLGRGELISFLQNLWAGATSQLDALVVLVLLRAPADGLPLAVAFHILRPLLSAGHNWTRIFYFDYQKLQSLYPRLFRQRFERFLRAVALLMSLCLSVSAVVVVWGIAPAAFRPSLGWLIPFTVARSFYGLYQIQGFSYHRYDYLAKLTLPIAVGLFLVAVFPISQTVTLLAITALLALSIRCAGAPQSMKTDARQIPPRKLGLAQWLAHLCERDQPVRLGVATVDGRLCQTSAAVRALAALLGPGSIARWGTRHVLWFEHADQRLPVQRDVIIAALAGSLSDITLQETCENGSSALRRALAHGLMGAELTATLSLARRGDTSADLRSEFYSHHPNGIILDFRSGGIDFRQHPLDPVQLRQIFKEVRQLVHGIAPRRSKLNPFSVAVYAPKGEPELVFLHQMRDGDAAHWRRRVARASLADSIPVLDGIAVL